MVCKIVRFIIHTQIPQSPIHYYQEIGRAGRDGKPADIILFYNPEDKSLPLSFIEGGRPSVHKYEQVIAAIHREPLGVKDLMRKTNLKQTRQPEKPEQNANLLLIQKGGIPVDFNGIRIPVSFSENHVLKQAGIVEDPKATIENTDLTLF